MKSHLYRVLVLISSVNYGISVPPDFCMHPLNKADCNVPPKPVFSYYHPGSRCEIELWRGCPTRNMFQDEVSCSSVCIFKMYSGAESSRLVHSDETDGKISLLKGTDPCIDRFDGGDCGQPKQMKYYLAGDTCVKTEWMGCKSKNLFDNLPACIKACNPIMYFEPDIKEAIGNLTKDEIHDLDKMIVHAIKEEIELTELPTLPTKSSLEEKNHLHKDNATSDEMDNNDFADDVDYDKELVEAVSAEPEHEADKLAAPDDSVEGSMEEVYTLS